MDARTKIDAVPAPQRNWALFLDIDGTLLDIAPRPDAVNVPPGLIAALKMASNWLDDALALVSGRLLPEIDALFAPLALPCAAEHGAVIRAAGGSLLEPPDAFRVPDAWRVHLERSAQGWHGVIVEPKAYSVAVHYRLAPDRRDDVHALLQEIASNNPDYEIMPARMAYELRHRRLHKGTAVQRLMQLTPFSGRVPVFVGDDITDEDGFKACRELGGIDLHVTKAFAGQPSNVRAWLKDFATQRAKAHRFNRTWE